jgi:hypothetical protein
MTYDASPGGFVYVHETGEPVALDQETFDTMRLYPHYHATIEDFTACQECIDRAADLRIASGN